MPRLLLVSNRHGEDALACRVLDRLVARMAEAGGQRMGGPAGSEAIAAAVLAELAARAS